jgi:hypothetical protein
MYDLLVIGDDLASHVSAAYAAQNGLKTLLIAESGLGGLQVLGDFVFNLDAMPLSGFGTGQLGLSILEQLEIPLPEEAAVFPDPAYQIVLPEHRIDFSGNLSLLKTEFAREFPEFETEISAHFDMTVEASSTFQNWMENHPEIQPRSFREYIDYLKIYPDIFKYKYGIIAFDRILSQNASLEKVWEAQQALLSFNLHDMFSFAAAFQYCSPLRGVSYFSSGKQFLFNALIEKLESKEGLYLPHYGLESLTHSKTIELEMKAPDGKVLRTSGQNCIVSTKSGQLPRILGQKKFIHLSDWFRPAKILYYPFTLFLGVPAKYLPEQMARHIAVVPDVAKDLYDNNLIILETSPPEKDKPLSASITSVSATVYLPDHPQCWTTEALHCEARNLIDRLEFFLPFFQDNILYLDIDQSIDISMNYRGILNPKYDVRNPFLTSFSAKSHKTRFPNIFLTGASLLSDAGFDAEMISGRNAARQVINQRR